MRIETDTTDQAADQTRKALRDMKHDWQRKLQYASDDLRLEIGMEAVRAQRTSLALDTLAKEIKRCKRELPWGA
jgi:hypothetical protein